jgi:prephenate dehydrogenase
MNVKTLTIVGVGLIGGSIGLAARRRGVVKRVLGVSRDLAGVARAKALGIIDDGLLDLTEPVRCSELVIFCTPVDRIASQVLAAAPACAPGTLLTDAGSTKAAIVRAVEGRLPPGVDFVGGHPLAGSEKRGLEHAHPDLFQGRLTILTQTPRTATKAVEEIAAFWTGLGAHVRVMDPEQHDRALALTSHLPHLAAAALSAILPPHLHDLVASGFRDTTRVAAGDPALWTGIFVQNRTAVLEALNQLEERLSQFRAALEKGDSAAFDALLAQAKKVRDTLGN